MRDAYTLFDQVVSFSGDTITMAQIEDKLGLAGLDKLSAIIEPLATGNSEASLLALDALLEAGVSVEQAIKELAQYFRTLLLASCGIRSESILAVQLSHIPEHLLHTYTEEQLEAALDLFLRLYRDIRFSLSPRFELELAVSRLANLSHMASSATLVKKMELLQNQLAGKAPLAEPNRAPKAEPKQVQQEKPPAKMQQAPKPVMEKKLSLNKATLAELTQLAAAQRDQIGLIFGQAVDLELKEEVLHITFSSQYALDSAKAHQKELSSFLTRHSGFEGNIVMQKLVKPPKADKKETSDKLAEDVASLFRGEVVHPS
jgi:DNA polymerase-3 subunit gamma/tau